MLIVDDEPLMRTYLANCIPTFSNQFQVTGIAKDGFEAIELLNKHRYNLVITDIQMPEINGLNLARYINDNFSDTIVVIISGYSEFEYARQAIKYNVTDYLLKPLVDQTLIDLLESTAQRLKSKKSSAYLTGSNPSSDKDFKKSLIQSILDENMNTTYELFMQLKKRSLTIMHTYGSILKFTLDELDLLLKNADAFDVTTEHLRLNQIIEEYCENYGFVCLYNRDGSTYVLCDGESIDLLNQNILQLYKSIQKNLCGLPAIKCICGKPVTDIMKLPYSLQSIEDMFPLTLFKKEYPINVMCTKEEELRISKIQKSTNQIFTDFLSQSTDKLYIDIKTYCNLFKDEFNYSSVLRYGAYLIQYICAKANFNPTYKRKAYNKLIKQVNNYLQIGLPDESTIIQIYNNTIFVLISSDHTPPETTQIVHTAKNYILSHYQENISLSDVAEFCGVSSSYLSDLFHKTFQETYSKYLLRIRMEQAAKLLRQSPDIKIYSVAKQTGFVSTKHFSSVFKKYYGVTPTNYINGNH